MNEVLARKKTSPSSIYLKYSIERVLTYCLPPLTLYLKSETKTPSCMK
jgi:hypothetical protein